MSLIQLLSSPLFIMLLSCVQLFATPWPVACQPPLSMGFSRQEYCSGLSFPPPGDLPGPGMEPRSPALAAGFFTTEPRGMLISATDWTGIHPMQGPG